MSEWFQAKVKFLRQTDNGLIKQITEQYLVDSMSFTECESRVLDEVGRDMREIQMMSVARSNVKEVVMYGDTDLFHKVKVQYSIMDEVTEKEKKITTYLLVNANDIKEATERTEEYLKEMLIPFRITKVEESPIIEVYEYESNQRVGNHNSAGAYYDEELTEEQKDMLKERACDAQSMDDATLFKGTPIPALSDRERGLVRSLLKHFCEFCPPTNPQQSSTDHGALVEYLRSIGREGLTVGELDDMTRCASEMLLGEFSDHVWGEFEIEREDSDSIWSILNDK